VTIRTFLMTGLLAAVGVTILADDAQAIGRRGRRGGGGCGGCGGSAYAGSGGCGGGYAYGGTMGYSSGGCGGCGSAAGALSMPGYPIGAGAVTVPVEMTPGGTTVVTGTGASTTIGATTTGTIPVQGQGFIPVQNQGVIPGGFQYNPNVYYPQGTYGEIIPSGYNYSPTVPTYTGGGRRGIFRR
jgi:hypothetical protein